MDFLQEIISEDKEMQTIIVALEPDPRKYVCSKLKAAGTYMTGTIALASLETTISNSQSVSSESRSIMS